MREILLIVHILAAAAWIGLNLAQFVFVPRLVRAGNDAAAAWMGAFVDLGRIYNTPAAIVILASGVGLVIDSAVYEFEHVFVVIGVVMVIIGGVLGARVYAPLGRAAQAAYISDDQGAAQTATEGIIRIGAIETLLLVVTVVAMVNRWGA